MANSPFNFISTIFLLFALFTLPHSLSQTSPSPSPQLPADVVPPPSSDHSPPPSPSPLSPSHSPIASPPSPPSDLAPESSPSPSPSPTPAPAPSPTYYGPKKGMHPSPALAADVEDATGTSSSGGGMKGGQKAGIAVGVIAGVCVVGVAALVYKKRRHNIQRAEFGYAARRDIL